MFWRVYCHQNSAKTTTKTVYEPFCVLFNCSKSAVTIIPTARVIFYNNCGQVYDCLPLHELAPFIQMAWKLTRCWIQFNWAYYVGLVNLELRPLFAFYSLSSTRWIPMKPFCWREDDIQQHNVIFWMIS